MRVVEGRVARILTRTSGYLSEVTSHSLQPYRGCSFGNSLCGRACYVAHNRFLTRGERWGSFLEARVNAAESYLERAPSERRWARRRGREFSIFMASSTEPFLPQERQLGVTRRVLEAMLDEPPDRLVVQTHSAAVAEHSDLLLRLSRRCQLRVHLSIETDRERFAGLPPHGSSIQSRFEAAGQLRESGLKVVITVSPLLPLEAPEGFFKAIDQVAEAVVLDHYIEGDGSKNGSRTLATGLPALLAPSYPDWPRLAYRDAMAAVASRVMRGQVGISRDGFAGRYLSRSRRDQLEEQYPCSG
ncbi:MAG: hypothetical protein KC910_29870 [Candidatus Eremiobacteraeota bacterium]|nr:hypothetical protein [Candidatus Eremiobacteraeota bacterium]